MPSYPYPRLELKYCERCGGLWLRPQDSDAVYCATCAEAIAELPPPRGGTPPGTLHAGYEPLIALLAFVAGITDCLGGVLA